MNEVDTEEYMVGVIALIGDYLVEKNILRGNPSQNTGTEYENSIFSISAHDWHDKTDSPNFWYKPLNLKIFWYKHVGRGCYSSRPVTIDDAVTMLFDCIKSIDRDSAVAREVIPEFWEENEEE